MISIVSAIYSEKIEFECRVTVRGENIDEKILAPCGNCRQLPNTYMSYGDVVSNTSEAVMKVKV